MSKDLDTDIRRYVHTKTYLHILVCSRVHSHRHIYRDMYLQRPSHTQTCTDMYTHRPVRDTQIWVHTEMCAYNDMCRDLCSETCMHANMPTDTAAQTCPRRWFSAGDTPEVGSPEQKHWMACCLSDGGVNERSLGISLTEHTSEHFLLLILQSNCPHTQQPH